MSSSPDEVPRPSAPPSFATDEGRLVLYYGWIEQRLADKTIEREKLYTSEERIGFFMAWMRAMIEHKHFRPQSRLPAYRDLTTLPFHLQKEQIAEAVLRLRAEKVLPSRKTRKDADLSQWTPRDTFSWWYIGHMRALRFDQARRLLARESPYEIEGGLLSVSRTSEIISRWTEEKYAVYRQIFHGEPGWIYLTRRGLRQVHLDFRAEAPSSRTLEHLYWINEVRLHVEKETKGEMEWISERSIQAEQERRQRGEKRTHIPDGILVMNGTKIDIEVQVSKPSPGEVEAVMGDFWRSGSHNALRYYVGRYSRGVVRATYQKMVREVRAMRPSIEIIDLKTWLPIDLTE